LEPRVKEAGAEKLILAPAVFAGGLSIKMSKIQGASEERWGAAICTARKGWTSVMLQKKPFKLQVAASGCNWLQVSSIGCK
jgi:hypothetical protein